MAIYNYKIIDIMRRQARLRSWTCTQADDGGDMQDDRWQRSIKTKSKPCAVPGIIDRYYGYRRIGHTFPFTCRTVAQKLETQNEKEDQISIRTTPDNAESEVFSDSRRFFHDFFLVSQSVSLLHSHIDIKSNT